MTHEYIYSLSDPKATLETVGGKGASLARLAAAGLPVPDGFHVTTAAYRQFVKQEGLQARIMEALSGVDVAQPSTLETASHRICDLFERTAIPPEVAAAIAHAYGNLPGSNPPVAVRSSATAEDLPEASFAGQQETYLNVSGPAAVLEAARRCWASLWTARAIGYRARQGIPPESVALAVVVQLLVPAEAAGILFTADPVSGRRDRLVVSASWGLGEAVVGGLVTPDAITLDKESGRVLERQTADKQIMTVRINGGTREQPVPEDLRRAPVLDDQMTAELAGLGARIERLYETPMDVEWALADGKMAIVQARPITALPAAPPEEAAPEAPAPTEWPLPDPKKVYTRGSLAEHLPNAVTPLFGSLGMRVANEATGAFMRELVGDGAFQLSYFVINGYVYGGTRMSLKAMLSFGKTMLLQLRPLLGTAAGRWQAARGRLIELVREWEGRPVEALAPSELLAGTREVLGQAIRLYTVLQSGTLPAATVSETVFARFYDGLVKRKGDPEATAFLFGLDSAPILAEKSLFDLAAWCRQRPGLAAHLLHTPAGEIVAELAAGQPAAGVTPEVWWAWRERFQVHLRAHGRSAYELDFANATPAEAPEPLLETLKMYLAGQGTNPYDRQSEYAERREQATRAVLARLGWPRRGWFQKLLKWAQACGPLREDSLADLGMGHRQIRRMLGELGRRFAAGGAIAKAEDIYWLEEHEVEELVTRLEQGDPLPNLGGRIPARRAEFRAARKVAAPAVLPQRSRLGKLVPWSEQRQTDQEVLRGLGTSAGQITAPACVLHGPEDFGKMRPGHVLVATTTTPAWTPLFAMASAVVTDIGGPLSHSSIVAREFGVPAVTAVGIAARRIRQGQMVTVDGAAGTVTLIAGEASGARPGAGPDGGGPAAGPSAPDPWKLSNPKEHYMRAGALELLPDPISPLFATWGAPAITRGLVQLMNDLVGMSLDSLPENYVTTVNGYAYGKVNFTPRQWWLMLVGLVPAFPKMLREGVPYWQNVVLPAYAETVARWRDRELTEASPAELLAGAREIVEAFAYHLGILQASTMGPTASSEGLFTQVYEKLVRRDGDPCAPTFLLGFDSLPIRGEKTLYDLAQWCREREGLRAHLVATPAGEIAAHLYDLQAPAGVPVQEWDEWQARFDGYLERFGYAIYDMDFAKPLPVDDPAPMLETVKLFLTGQGKSPYERQGAAAERRDEAVTAIRARLRGLRRWAFEKALAWAQSQAPLREDGLAEIGLGYPVLRRMLRELGQRFAEAEMIEAAEDIYWLELKEVEVAVAALERGERLSDHAAQVSRRKAEWHAQKRLTPPPQLPAKAKIAGINWEIFLAGRAAAAEGDLIRGAGVSPGNVTATARVLHGPDDFDQMRAGDVLVAAITTPAWTPLFALAAGVVTDIGGTLSHSSIVAREYGIPAVLGTGVATKRIHSGQVVTVDGSAGTVKVKSEERTHGDGR